MTGKPELYFPTDVTPEQLFRAIGKLRKDARDEIDRLIRFLDETDDYVMTELEDDGDSGIADLDGLLEQIGSPDCMGAGGGSV
jgi:hypothetical protein